jgi:hypothetical protein
MDEVEKMKERIESERRQDREINEKERKKIADM